MLSDKQKEALEAIRLCVYLRIPDDHYPFTAAIGTARREDVACRIIDEIMDRMGSATLLALDADDAVNRVVFEFFAYGRKSPETGVIESVIPLARVGKSSIDRHPPLASPHVALLRSLNSRESSLKRMIPRRGAGEED